MKGYRDLIKQAVSPETWQLIVARAVCQAVNGDSEARNFLSTWLQNESFAESLLSAAGGDERAAVRVANGLAVPATSIEKLRAEFLADAAKAQESPTQRGRKPNPRQAL